MSSGFDLNFLIYDASRGLSLILDNACEFNGKGGFKQSVSDFRQSRRLEIA